MHFPASGIIIRGGNGTVPGKRQPRSTRGIRCEPETTAAGILRIDTRISKADLVLPIFPDAPQNIAQRSNAEKKISGKIPRSVKGVGYASVSNAAGGLRKSCNPVFRRLQPCDFPITFASAFRRHRNHPGGLNVFARSMIKNTVHCRKLPMWRAAGNEHGKRQRIRPIRDTGDFKKFHVLKGLEKCNPITTTAIFKLKMIS